MKKTFATLAIVLTAPVLADVSVTMHVVDASGIGAPVGTVTVSQSAHGLVFKPALTGLSAGLHGFHLHQNASCAPGAQEGKTVPA
ncbi:MAG: superoxide dismutase family protein, partial [Gammaproteobacteria bacterium]